jgi:RNA polymerase sigma factor (sigma-70 family)
MPRVRRGKTRRQSRSKPADEVGRGLQGQAGVGGLLFSGLASLAIVMAGMNQRKIDPPVAGISPGLFATTHWSVVLRAKDKSQAALGSLCQNYRQPLLIWLRSRGHAPADAEDLVQGFFAHLFKRDFLGNVAQEKGKFRTFLLSSFKNFLSDAYDKASAQKRGEGQIAASLQETDESGRVIHDPAAPGSAPDLEYDRAWARAVLANSLSRLEQECARTGHAALCSALQPVLFADETALPYKAIAAQLRMSTGALTVAAHRLRARLKGIIRDEVLQTVTGEQEWEEEVRYLISLFGR